ncbi:hypothetical protein [Sorangium sp. So ce1078]|uniref:hypothetical protein n=1 Tax=Sorangium sp. So ce1078 TaxID=3133329 RepID=UPI003F5D6E9F
MLTLMADMVTCLRDRGGLAVLRDATEEQGLSLARRFVSRAPRSWDGVAQHTRMDHDADKVVERGADDAADLRVRLRTTALFVCLRELHGQQAIRDELDSAYA